LLKAVNDIVANMKKNGELDAISNKWLHQPLPASLKG
jgi:ABC-type amino acid transport substrate-binding protein